jgi:hypothetical protein
MDQISHVCFLECIETSFFDDGTSVSNVIGRAAFPAPSDPPHLYSGATLSEGQKYVTSMVDDLTSIGYSIVDIGPYWYSVRLERVWPDDPEARMAVPEPLDDDDTLSWPEQTPREEEGSRQPWQYWPTEKGPLFYVFWGLILFLVIPFIIGILIRFFAFLLP